MQKNLNRKAKALAEVNKEIQKKFPKVELVRGEGYYYIASDDPETGLKLAGLNSTGIYGAYRLNQMTIQQWLDAVNELMSDKDYFIAGDESGSV